MLEVVRLEIEKVIGIDCLMKYLTWSTLSEPLKWVTLFNCEWYDLTRPGGTHKHNHYKIIEINHAKRYEKFDPFIIT